MNSDRCSPNSNTYIPNLPSYACDNIFTSTNAVTTSTSSACTEGCCCYSCPPTTSLGYSSPSYSYSYNYGPRQSDCVGGGDSTNMRLVSQSLPSINYTGLPTYVSHYMNTPPVAGYYPPSNYYNISNPTYPSTVSSFASANSAFKKYPINAGQSNPNQSFQRNPIQPTSNQAAYDDFSLKKYPISYGQSNPVNYQSFQRNAIQPTSYQAATNDSALKNYSLSYGQSNPVNYQSFQRDAMQLTSNQKAKHVSVMRKYPISYGQSNPLNYQSFQRNEIRQISNQTATHGSALKNYSASYEQSNPLNYQSFQKNAIEQTLYQTTSHESALKTFPISNYGQSNPVKIQNCENNAIKSHSKQKDSHNHADSSHYNDSTMGTASPNGKYSVKTPVVSVPLNPTDSPDQLPVKIHDKYNLEFKSDKDTEADCVQQAETVSGKEDENIDPQDENNFYQFENIIDNNADTIFFQAENLSANNADYINYQAESENISDNSAEYISHQAENIGDKDDENSGYQIKNIDHQPKSLSDNNAENITHHAENINDNNAGNKLHQAEYVNDNDAKDHVAPQAAKSRRRRKVKEPTSTIDNSTNANPTEKKERKRGRRKKNLLVVSLPGGQQLFSVPLKQPSSGKSTYKKRERSAKKLNSPPVDSENSNGGSKLRYKRGNSHLKLVQCAPNMNPCVGTLEAFRNAYKKMASDSNETTNCQPGPSTSTYIDTADSDVEVVGCFPQGTTHYKPSQPFSEQQKSSVENEALNNLWQFSGNTGNPIPAPTDKMAVKTTMPCSRNVPQETTYYQQSQQISEQQKSSDNVESLNNSCSGNSISVPTDKVAAKATMPCSRNAPQRTTDYKQFQPLSEQQKNSDEVDSLSNCSSGNTGNSIPPPTDKVAVKATIPYSKNVNGHNLEGKRNDTVVATPENKILMPNQIHTSLQIERNNELIRTRTHEIGTTEVNNRGKLDLLCRNRIYHFMKKTNNNASNITKNESTNQNETAKSPSPVVLSLSLSDDDDDMTAAPKNDAQSVQATIKPVAKASAGASQCLDMPNLFDFSEICTPTIRQAIENEGVETDDSSDSEGIVTMHMHKNNNELNTNFGSTPSPTNSDQLENISVSKPLSHMDYFPSFLSEDSDDDDDYKPEQQLQVKNPPLENAANSKTNASNDASKDCQSELSDTDTSETEKSPCPSPIVYKNTSQFIQYRENVDEDDTGESENEMHQNTGPLAGEDFNIQRNSCFDSIKNGNEEENSNYDWAVESSVATIAARMAQLFVDEEYDTEGCISDDDESITGSEVSQRYDIEEYQQKRTWHLNGKFVSDTGSPSLWSPHIELNRNNSVNELWREELINSNKNAKNPHVLSHRYVTNEGVMYKTGCLNPCPKSTGESCNKKPNRYEDFVDESVGYLTRRSSACSRRESIQSEVSQRSQETLSKMRNEESAARENLLKINDAKTNISKTATDEKIGRRTIMYDDMGNRIIKRMAHCAQIPEELLPKRQKMLCRGFDSKPRQLELTSWHKNVRVNPSKTMSKLRCRTNSMIKKLVKYSRAQKSKSNKLVTNGTKSKLNADLDKVFILGSNTPKRKIQAEKLQEIMLEIPGPMERRPKVGSFIEEKRKETSSNRSVKPLEKEEIKEVIVSVDIRQPQRLHSSEKMLSLSESEDEENDKNGPTNSKNYGFMNNFTYKDKYKGIPIFPMQASARVDSEGNVVSPRTDNSEFDDDDEDILDIHAERDILLDMFD